MASPKNVVEWRTRPVPTCAESTAPRPCRSCKCLTRYLKTGVGDVKKLQPPRTEFRLRCGDYRVFFVLRGENAIKLCSVTEPSYDPPIRRTTHL